MKSQSTSSFRVSVVSNLCALVCAFCVASPLLRLPTAHAYSWHDCLDTPPSSYIESTPKALRLSSWIPSWLASRGHHQSDSARAIQTTSACDEQMGCLHFVNVTSSPDPVVRGEASQTVTKSAQWTGKEKIVGGLQVHFAQYYKVFGHWVPFLKIAVDFCKDNTNVCPIESLSTFTESKTHPPLNRLTPLGWYRSQQVYTLNGR